MASFELRAGARFDTVTPEEMAHLLEGQLMALLAAQRQPDVFSVTKQATVPADGVLGSGNLIELYAVPVGMVAIVHRINIEAAGYTRSAPLTAGWINFAVDTPIDTGVVVGVPAGSSAVAPGTIVDSLTAATVVKGGQRFGAYGAGLPAGVVLSFRCQIVLKETER